MELGDTQLDFEPISLAGGWSGHVLVNWRLADGTVSTESFQPSVDDWRESLERLTSDWTSMPACETLKSSRTAETIRCTMRLCSKPIDVICKHHVASTRNEAVAWRFFGSRERRTWNVGLELLRQGVPTALPRVVIERRRPRAEAWLVTEAIPRAIDLDSVLNWHLHSLALDRRFLVKSCLTRKLSELCARMTRSGIAHRDFKASNIVAGDWDSVGVRLWLVDLDGVRCRRSLRRDDRRSIVRLAASLSDSASVSRQDCARFLRQWLAALDGAQDGWRHLYREMARDVGRYNAAAKRRKHGKLDGFTD